jgi:hypothetical protein
MDPHELQLMQTYLWKIENTKELEHIALNVFGEGFDREFLLKAVRIRLSEKPVIKKMAWIYKPT